MSQRKLLLADDSITIQKVVNLTFADEGIEVITVGDGDSAMAKLDEISPDLVMADVHMPGLNGYQICERIRQSDALRQTPVILLVGSFEPFDETEAQRVGANDYLTKPFQSIRQLVNKVTDLLETASRQNGEDAAAAAAASPADAPESVSADLENARTLDDFEVPHEYFSESETEEPVADSSFAVETQFSDERGFAGMDDEMIESRRPGSSSSGFALDESMKFESSEIDEAEEVSAPETQPLSADDLQRFSFTHQHEETESAVPAQAETSFDVAGGGQSSDDQNDSVASSQHEANATTEEQQMATPQTAPILFDSDDDDDLLEIPFDEDEEEWDEPEPAATAAAATVTSAPEQTSEAYARESETGATNAGDDEEDRYATAAETTETGTAAQEQSETQYVSGPETSGGHTAASFEQSPAALEQNEVVAEEESSASATTAANAFASASQLSPEMIDAIAQRVVEKLSDRAVKDVAWEVVPQMADLIIKKMTEEKLKQ